MVQSPLMKEATATAQCCAGAGAIGALAARRARPRALNLGVIAAATKASADRANWGRSVGASIEMFESRYQLGAIIGSGTMGVVRVATRREDGHRLVVKCISSEDEEVRRFTRDEYELMRSLRHSAIMYPEAFYESGWKQMICMELCEEGSLKECVARSGPLTESVASVLFAQLLGGVSYLHHQRVVHRDLKPANLLLLDGGTRLKITDFNSATRIGKQAGVCTMLTDRGTKIYTAPELFLGLIWNERIDIWSSGFCLFFMLTGRIPLDNRDPHVCAALRRGELPPISWEGMTWSARSLIQQCLMFEMRDRPPAMELLLHPFLEGRRSTPWARSLSDGGLGDKSPGEAEYPPSWLPSCGLLNSSQALPPRQCGAELGHSEIAEVKLRAASENLATRMPRPHQRLSEGGWGCTLEGIETIEAAEVKAPEEVVVRRSAGRSFTLYSTMASPLKAKTRMISLPLYSDSPLNESPPSKMHTSGCSALLAKSWKEPRGRSEVLQLLVRRKLQRATF
mmetsp:Transcript_71009/g.154331  ORF Transcript_71009/g.154331 Transcript_71009/m.154331 type:complete len:511 (-) Transcript_71009:117-1649(-)